MRQLPDRVMRRLRIAVLFCAVLALVGTSLVGYAQPASAHAILVKAVPEPNTSVAELPEQIVLSFNERLESELFYIRMYDENGRLAVNEKAVISEDQKTVSLKVPDLGEGRFTVSYHVISADGHPVEGAYVLVAGEGSSGE